MSPLKQTGISKYASLPQRKYLLESDSTHALDNKKANWPALSLVAILSFSTVGCASLQALEPTADLINDLKKIL
ncbi:hypothetical protein AAIR29_05695 [Psychrobacter sp. FBL11]|uniref:Uncharacterized protein n=1 Tax=Psychrobacter saeujeotis TaxID=3143436 RepID=A0ABU9X6U8_9GAMM|nr:hypothetical protein [uncultured Psychrobacter sp.]